MVEPIIRFKKADGSSYPPVKVKTVGEVFKFVTEKNKDKQVDNVITNSAEYGMIPQRDFFDKDIATKDNTAGYTIIQKGDFVYNPRKSQYAPYGPFNCYRLEDKGIVSPLYTCLRPITDEVIEDYLEWYFASTSWHRYIYSNGAQGGARHDRVGMTNDLMKGIPVVVPSLEEQNMISETLGTVTNLISTLTEEVRLWEEKKKGVMQKIFSRKVRFKDENGEDYPEWEYLELSKLGELSNGISKGKEYFGHGNKMVNLQDVFGKDQIYPGEFSLVQTTDKELKEKNLIKGDVLFIRSSVKPEGVGLPSVVMETMEDTVYSGFIIRCRFFDEKLDIGYKRYCFVESEFRNEVLSKSSVSANTNINQPNLLGIKVKVPCLEEQQKIADCLSSIDEVIAIKKQKLETWKNIKKGLLQQMFV